MLNRRRIPSLAALLLGLPCVALASERIIKVTTTADAVDGDGECSLREAIETINNEATVDACVVTGDGDRFVVLLGDGHHELTYVDPESASVELVVRKPMTLRGAGAELTTIDAASRARVLTADSALSVEHLRLTGGHAGESFGGGIWARHAGHLQISHAVIDGNQADHGGGVFSLATTTTIRHTVVKDNIANQRSGGVGFHLNGEAGKNLIESSTIAGNHAWMGGGVGHDESTTELRQVTLSHNSAVEDAAVAHTEGSLLLDGVAVVGHDGVAVRHFDEGGDLTIHNSLFVDNDTPVAGGFKSAGVNYFESSAPVAHASESDVVVSRGDEPSTAIRPLEQAGGATPVHLPAFASPLIGRGSCVDRHGAFYGVDQRGAPRAIVGCTIGPVEFGALGLLTQVDLATDEQCPTGGLVSYSGEDNGLGGAVAGDRQLSGDEPHRVQVACHPAGSLVSVTDEAAGDHCEAGGQRIDTGRDLDGSGTLDEHEIESTRYVCTPPPPAPALIEIADFDASELCPAGGQRVTAGVDANRDGTLDDQEIVSSVETCHGQDGVDGQDGADGEDGLDGQHAESGCAAVGVSALALLGLAIRRR